MACAGDEQTVRKSCAPPSASCGRKRLCSSRQAPTKSGSVIAMAGWNSFVKRLRKPPPVPSFAQHSRSASKLDKRATKGPVYPRVFEAVFGLPWEAETAPGHQASLLQFGRLEA